MRMQNFVHSWWKCGLWIGVSLCVVTVQSCLVDARLAATETGKGVCAAGSLEQAGDRARRSVNGLERETLVLKLSCGGAPYVTEQVEALIAASQKPGLELPCVLRADGIARCTVPGTKQ